MSKSNFIKELENEIKSSPSSYTVEAETPYETKNGFWFEVEKNYVGVTYKYNIEIHFDNSLKLSTKICDFIAPLFDYVMEKYSYHKGRDVSYTISIVGHTDCRADYEGIYKVEEFLFMIFKDNLIKSKN